MGVNTKILLPPDVRARDVADVIGILAGLKPTKTMLTGGSYAADVEGASVRPTSIAEMAEIVIKGKLIDDEPMHHCCLHWESETVGRLLSPKCTAFWIATGRRLVGFFGGQITYSDCAGGVDFKAVRPRSRNNPETGQEWQDFQDEILAVKPLTKIEIAKWKSYAAYQ